jgi:hypothetical protein
MMKKKKFLMRDEKPVAKGRKPTLMHTSRVLGIYHFESLLEIYDILRGSWNLIIWKMYDLVSWQKGLLRPVYVHVTLSHDEERKLSSGSETRE